MVVEEGLDYPDQRTSWTSTSAAEEHESRRAGRAHTVHGRQQKPWSLRGWQAGRMGEGGGEERRKAFRPAILARGDAHMGSTWYQ